MTTATICTIGDEILIGQIVDTNSSLIASKLQLIGIKVVRMLSIADNREEIIQKLEAELSSVDIVITTGGLGPTKDDITKDALMELSGSIEYIRNEKQAAIIDRILSSRGLQRLESNLAQALVPDRAEIIPNRFGTAPIMVLRSKKGKGILYSMPGVPFETSNMLPDVLDDISRRFPLESIQHRSIMVYGLAESALSELIAPWEDNLPEGMHLAYLPNPLFGIKLRLSVYGGDRELSEKSLDRETKKLSEILGNKIYATSESTLEEALGSILREKGRTLSAAESCTGGEIAHLITTVPGASDYFLGSVTSYAVSVKEKVLGVSHETIEKNGVVSSEVAAEMARGVRALTGSDYAVATTGLASLEPDRFNPGGTVWIGVDGPLGTRTLKRNYQNDRKRNIQRFAATALDFLRLYILEAESFDRQKIKHLC